MSSDMIDEMEKELSRIEEDALHSSKGHYNDSDWWRKLHLSIGIPNAIIASIAGISAFDGSTILAGSLSIVVAAITALNTFLNPGDRASTHNRCATEYHSLKNRCRVFRNIWLRNVGNEDELKARFEELVIRRDDLNTTSPQISERAFKKARKGIDEGEAKYRRDH